MKLGIAGPPQSGKTTLLTLLTGEEPGADSQAGRTVSKVVRVPDARLEHLREVFTPKSYKPATFTITDYGMAVSNEQRIGEERNADALIVVLPAFDGKDPAAAAEEIDTEWTLLDMQVAERRIEKIEARQKRPIPAKERDELEAEAAVMRRVLAWVSEERPLRDMDLEPKELKQLKPYGMFTLKPRLMVVNAGEKVVPYASATAEALGVPGASLVCARLEAELTLMDPEERAMFAGEYGIEELARERLIREAYQLLGLCAFFTTGPDEVRAWTIPVHTSALEAAGEIHSDIQRGFIRAEVVANGDFVAAGSNMKKAKADHKVRLEGKDYIVQDADIIDFRFNV